MNKLWQIEIIIYNGILNEYIPHLVEVAADTPYKAIKALTKNYKYCNIYSIVIKEMDKHHDEEK